MASPSGSMGSSPNFVERAGSSRSMREGSADSEEASDRVQVPNFDMLSDVESWKSSTGSDLSRSMNNSSMTTGADRDGIIVPKKQFKTNEERLEAIGMANNIGIYQACIYYEVSEQTIRRWIKCETLIRAMDPIERKYYLQHHNVPEEVKEMLANYIRTVEDFWPLNIKDVKNRLRCFSRELGFPSFAAVPGLHTFLRAFKAEYKLEGSFVVN